MKDPVEFHASGKLLITGEYLVLAGASALALPLRFGQSMEISESAAGNLGWVSTTPEGTWFRAQIDPLSFRIISTSNLKVAANLKKVLTAAHLLNPRIIPAGAGCQVNVAANYPLHWGLGSSSTLISLIAAWAGVDEFLLYRMVSKGSGYDIACTHEKGLIFYTLTERGRQIIPARPGPALRNCTYFTYLGNKQDSGKEVSAFLMNNRYSKQHIDHISELSLKICGAETPEQLISLVSEHETILSGILQRPVIAKRFPGFPGAVKSLGAWGGDFCMFVSGQDPDEVRNILQGYGFKNTFRFGEIEAT